MAIEVYLNFKGNCREAVEYYAQVFKTEEPKIMTFGEMPPNEEYPLPEEAKNLIMHTRLTCVEVSSCFLIHSLVCPSLKEITLA